jgi:alpha-1,3-glucosyltransferase
MAPEWGVVQGCAFGSLSQKDQASPAASVVAGRCPLNLTRAVTRSGLRVSPIKNCRQVSMTALDELPFANVSTSLTLSIFCGLALLRILVGFQPHSGQDNYHGIHAAYGGDFEAQRHWMELTLHLPLGSWYWYDLPYWGLDYPPLTAYLSWVCGFLSDRLVGPETVALESSRGMEDSVHKAYMRGTVVVLDLAVYGTAAWFMTRPKGKFKHDKKSLWIFATVMAQPAIVLIDHGHFQYNTTALGLSLWAFYFITKPEMWCCVVGSIFFCLALSFKQMTLYYAPVVGCYLLGRCLAARWRQRAVHRIAILGATVILCFVLLWMPFVVYGPADTSYQQRLVHVLRRIFPLQRGLFEGKVANIWCTLSVRPFRIRQRIPEELQPLAAFFMTALLIMPSCYRVFRVGQSSVVSAPISSHRIALLWGATNCALGFFLASFQVHEKSILLALAPATFLLLEDATFVEWFSVVTTWTLWPLLVIDRLQVAYVCSILIFVAMTQIRTELAERKAPSTNIGILEQYSLFRWIPSLAYVLMGALHVAEVIMSAPAALPDLFPVLWSIVGCAFCCMAYAISCWHLFFDEVVYQLKEKSL